MIITIIVISILLGFVLNNSVLGFSIAIGFWLMGWIITRPDNLRPTVKPLTRPVQRTNVVDKLLKKQIDLKYSIFDEKTILAFSKKWLTSTALFEVKIDNRSSDLGKLLDRIFEEGIPLFYYVLHKPIQYGEGTDTVRHRTKIIVGIRLSKKIKHVDREVIDVLLSQIRMAASRLKKTMLRYYPSYRIRQLEDFELLQTFQAIVFSPKSEDFQRDPKSLWVKVEKK
jgi:hypothetical protein